MLSGSSGDPSEWQQLSTLSVAWMLPWILHSAGLLGLYILSLLQILHSNCIPTFSGSCLASSHSPAHNSSTVSLIMQTAFFNITATLPLVVCFLLLGSSLMHVGPCSDTWIGIIGVSQNSQLSPYTDLAFFQMWHSDRLEDYFWGVHLKWRLDVINPVLTRAWQQTMVFTCCVDAPLIQPHSTFWLAEDMCSLSLTFSSISSSFL